jgi:hypothetical protein
MTKPGAAGASLDSSNESLDLCRSATLPKLHDSGMLDLIAALLSLPNNQNLISSKTRASRTKIAIAEIRMIVLERDFLISTLVVPVAVSNVLLIL